MREMEELKLKRTTFREPIIRGNRSKLSVPTSQGDCTGLGKRVVPRLRELAPRGQREPGGGIHATLGPFYSPSLKCGGRAPAAIEA